MIRLIGYFFGIGTTLALLVAAGVAIYVGHLTKELPDYEVLAKYEPPVTTRIHASDGSLMAEYAHERRLYLPIQAIPDRVKAAFMSADPQAARFWLTEVFLFPVLTELVDDKNLMGHKYDFYGGQPVNEVFAEALSQVDPSFEFAPFQDYVNLQIEDHFAQAIAGHGTLADAFDRIQDAVVAYAGDQGYTVK